jgi:putative Holliday junction resolvase
MDFGNVRIGIALSDPLKIMASPYEVYKRVDEIDDIKYIANLIKEKEVSTLVVGLPKHLDGNEGKTADAVREFIDKLLDTVKIEVVFHDERFTSKSAEQFLIGADVKRKKRKSVIDKMAAQIILQNYLDKIRN